MTPKQLERKYRTLVNRIKNANKELEILRDEVADTCHHPEEFLYKYMKDYDDGYGHWWKREHVRCLVCGKFKSNYSGWLSEK